MEYLELVLNLVAGLVGFPALLAALINVAKYFGWLKDGSAPKVNMLAHLVAYVGVGLAVYFGKVDLVGGVDVQLSAAANILLAVLAFLSSMTAATRFHFNYRVASLPMIGFSHKDKYFDSQVVGEPQG